MAYQILSKKDQKIFDIDLVKNYLRISNNYDDEWISELIECSICSAEQFLRITIIPITIKMKFEQIYNSRIRLELSPIASITEITTVENLNTISQIKHYAVKEDMVIFSNLPKFDYLTVEYTAGYINQNHIPQAIKQGMMLHIAEMYDSHGTTASISAEVQKLYQPYRKMLV